MTSKQLADALHDQLHAIPGMPAHDEATIRNSNAHAYQRSRNANAPHRSMANTAARNTTTRHGNPRVLVGWQQRIARLFSKKAHIRLP
jgi:hypothetical protein